MAEALLTQFRVPVGQKHPIHSIVLTPSGQGVFDINKDGNVIFSKKVAGRYPTAEEIGGLLSL